MEQRPNLQQQEGYYTDRWKNFAFANSLDMARIGSVLGILANTGSTTPTICDLGCGAGWSTSVLGMFGRALGVDLSDTTLASQRFPHCTFVSANILDWESPCEAFDVVVSMEVIEHIERPLQPKFVDVAHRVLKPGGHLILTTPNARTMRAMAGGGREWSNQPIEDWLDADELRRLLGARFQVHRVDSIILGMGVRGLYRFMNSTKVNRFMNRVRTTRAWDRARARGMYGLHLLAHGQKPAHH
ncbi:MAG: class I SAM-dependent methyltransferase [Deltaproteobacteria bacterium]